jgi:hypothetical protein
MWNDEERREAEPGLHQVVSSWALVVAILVGLAGWSALQYAAQVVGPILTREKSSAVTAIPSAMEVTRQTDAFVAPCHASAERIPSEADSVRGHHMAADDAPRPAVPKASYCQDSSSNPFGLPGAAMAVEWEALH